jgi:hypothetical protein
MTPIFSEKQKMKGIWIALIPALIIVTLSMYQKGFNSTDLTPMITSITLVLLVIILLLKMQLKTAIFEDRIEVQYFPFHLKQRIIRFDELTSFETRVADCAKEYWGWGYKGTKKNRSYTAYGDFGLQLTFKNGNRLFIGSQKQGELEQVVNQLKGGELGSEKL